MQKNTKQSPKSISDLTLDKSQDKGGHAAAFLRLCERELGRSIRKLHDENLDIGALRADGVFVRKNKGHPVFDFAGEFHPRKSPLREEDRFKSLAELGLFFNFEFGPPATARFLDGYFTPGNLSRAERVELRKKLVKNLDRVFYTRLRNFDKFCTQQNASFAPISISGCRGWRRTSVPEADVQRLMARSAEIMENAKVLKSGRSSRVVLVEDFPHGPAVLKRMVPRDLHSRIKNMLRPAKALRGWRFANGLVLRRVPCALPLAFWTRGAKGYLLTKFVDATPLRVLLRSNVPAWNEMERAAAGEKLAALLAKTVRNLHNMGYSHRDLKPSNILVELKAGIPIGVYIMDVDGIRAQYQPVPMSKRAKDLGRMAAPLTPFFGKEDCFIGRLVENYLGWSAAKPDLVSQLSNLVRAQAARYSLRKR